MATVGVGSDNGDDGVIGSVSVVAMVVLCWYGCYWWLMHCYW